MRSTAVLARIVLRPGTGGLGLAACNRRRGPARGSARCRHGRRRRGARRRPRSAFCSIASCLANMNAETMPATNSMAMPAISTANTVVVSSSSRCQASRSQFRRLLRVGIGGVPVAHEALLPNGSPPRAETSRPAGAVPTCGSGETVRTSAVSADSISATVAAEQAARFPRLFGGGCDNPSRSPTLKEFTKCVFFRSSQQPPSACSP